MARTNRQIRVAVAASVAAVLVALVCSVLTASPAAAHATISKAEPADQAHLAMSPPTMTIWFSEAVSPQVGGMTVISADRQEVQTAVSQPTPDALQATLKPDLPQGTYVATYRIISEDGHPISGSLVFGVGNGQLTDVSGLTTTTDATMDALSKAGQFLVYLGALAAAGLVFFLALIYEPCPSGGARHERERRRLARLAGWGTGVAVVGMAVVILAQTAQATGQGLGAAFDGSKLSGVLHQGLGAQDAGILIGLALGMVSLFLPRGAGQKLLAGVGGVIATASFVLWGHAIEGTDTWLTIPADAIHVMVAAVWFGGLVGLYIVLRSRSRSGQVPSEADGIAVAPAARHTSEPVTTGAHESPGQPTIASAGGSGSVTAVLDDPAPVDGGASVMVPGRDAGGPAAANGSAPTGGGSGDAGDLAATILCVRRFSAAAFVALLALSAAGIAVGIIEMGGLGTLFSSTYGRLLLAKLAIVGVVAAVAGYNRFYLLPWLLEDSPEAAHVDEARQRAGWKTLLATVRFEALAIVVVLAITAVLVNSTPGGTPAKPAPSTPLHQSQTFDGGQATLDISPNRPGVNAIMVEVTGTDGKPKDVLETQVEMTLASAGVGPITRKLDKLAPGHFMLGETRDLSIPGDWEIRVVLRVDEFDETPLTFKDTIS
jgi:copper transport protein